VTEDEKTVGAVRQSFGWRQVREVTVATADQRRADLVDRVHHGARFSDDFLLMLTAVWPAGIATFAETDRHHHHELDEIADALSYVESELGIPF